MHGATMKFIDATKYIDTKYIDTKAAYIEKLASYLKMANS